MKMITQHSRMRDEYLLPIVAALPDDAREDIELIKDVRDLMAYCANALEPGLGPPYIEELRHLHNGYGCWLDEVARAIVDAKIPDEEKYLILAAFNATKGLLLLLYIPESPERRQAIDQVWLDIPFRGL